MKTNMINTNSVIKTICAVVMLLGMSVSAWGTTTSGPVTLPAGSTTYNANDWKNHYAPNGYPSAELSQTIVVSTDNGYDMKFFHAADFGSTDGLQLERAQNAYIEMTINSSNGVDIVIGYISNGASFDINLTGASNVTAPSSSSATTATIKTSSTSATLKINGNSNNVVYISYIKITAKSSGTITIDDDDCTLGEHITYSISELTESLTPAEAYASGSGGNFSKTIKVSGVNMNPCSYIDYLYYDFENGSSGWNDSWYFSITASSSSDDNSQITSSTLSETLTISYYFDEEPTSGDYSADLYTWYWDDDCENYVEFGRMTVTLTVTAACTSHTISLTNSGTGTNGNFSADKSSACEDATITLTASPSSGYELDEWTVSKAGGGTCTVNGSNQFTMPDVNVTVSATFKAATYSLSFDKNGGNGTMSSVDRVYNSTAAIPTCTFTRAGYVCDGWATSSGGDKVYNQGANYTMGAGDATLYAHWVLAPQALKAWCETTFGIYDQAGTGDADIHLTSVYNTTVYATSSANNLITINAENLDAISNLGGGTANKQNIQIKYLDANNGDAEVDKTQSPFRLCNDGSSNYNVADGGNINLNGLTDFVQSYSISYTPKDYGVTDHYKLQLRLQNNSTEAKTVTLDLYGRSLPKEFVIAAKSGETWYALPNTLPGTEGAQTAISPIAITVDNATTPTKVTNPDVSVVYGATDRYTSANRNGIRFTNDGAHWIQISKTIDNYKLWLSSSGGTNVQDWYLKSNDFGAYEVFMDPIGSPDETRRIELYNSDGVKIGHHGTRAGTGNIYLLPVEYSKVDDDMSEPSIMEWGTDHVVMELRNSGLAYSYKTQVGGGALSDATALYTVRKDAGVYRLPITITTADAGKELKIYFYKTDDAVDGVASFTIPVMISADDATTSSIDKATAAQCDLVVLNGGVLTVSETSSSAKKTFRDLYIYGGGKMVVPEGTLIYFSHVYMRGGHLNSSWQYQYSNPQLVLNGTMGNASDTINYDYLTNNAQFYSLALPYPVKLKDIVNPYFNNKRSWEIHAYDGLSRSTGGTGWYDVEVGTGVAPNRIEGLGAENALSVGVGYTFWGAMQKVNTVRQMWSVNRFPMLLESGTPETEKFGEEDGVTVKAYGMTYNEDSLKYVYDENIRKNNAGWNMVGNPFLANINGSEDLETSMEAIIIDHHEEKVLNDKGQWTGQTKWVENEEHVRYVRIPYDNGEDYHQVRFKDTTLRAFHHFFIQVAVNGKFRLEKKYRAQNIIARMRANGAVLPAEMDIDFILRNGNDKTSFGLTVNDAFVTGFQAGEDMPDELGGVNMKGYTLANGERLSYNGLPSVAAEQLIPVGYRAQTAGTHTISYKHGRYDDYIEHIWLTDYVLGQTVDLLNGAYEFTTGAGVFDERFALNVVFNRNQMPTGIDEVESFETDEAPVKFIYNDKMFIRYKGIIYDATGKKVGEVIRNK